MKYNKTAYEVHYKEQVKGEWKEVRGSGYLDLELAKSRAKYIKKSGGVDVRILEAYWMDSTFVGFGKNLPYE